VVFPPGTDPLQVVAVHPTQLYETALMFLAFAWLWRLRDHAHGTGWRFGVYLVLAGTERFLIEIVRAKDDRLLGPFTLAQLTSVLLVLAGIYLMQRWREKEAVSPQPSEPRLKLMADG
jgi:phosphatidylglycerol:prolipoprotein diacylglycerol transferase